eukprot:gnl/TRDRNA2_/TRDRNA2_146680_c0_seq1.p2 gnl/TRDRNA2_/TRDRNA2_146680_c0~~gnl/TRDRNA2_/TRDRNA2_146680_c0_seq1.p2  ORF type:complete len:231 (+),score=25.65 gnl/TRDRNA2_/TRDRNA2_146680_c0_seq1:225-917(+)
MPPRCRRYVENAMQRLGIRTIYGAKYTEFLGDGGRLPSNNEFLWDAHGIKKPARVYMAVGVRAVNEFLPARTLTEKHNGKGGWIACNRKLQIVLDSNEESPFGGGRIFAAGNCCEVLGLDPLPKNSFPAEDMAAYVCHNIEAMEREGEDHCILWSSDASELTWRWGNGLCATSLGPYDGAFVMGQNVTPDSGYTVLTGYPSAMLKEFIRWSKVDQCRMGLVGRLVWGLVH